MFRICCSVWSPWPLENHSFPSFPIYRPSWVSGSILSLIFPPLTTPPPPPPAPPILLLLFLLLLRKPQLSSIQLLPLPFFTSPPDLFLFSFSSSPFHLLLLLLLLHSSFSIALSRSPLLSTLYLTTILLLLLSIRCFLAVFQRFLTPPPFRLLDAMDRQRASISRRQSVSRPELTQHASDQHVTHHSHPLLRLLQRSHLHFRSHRSSIPLDAGFDR